MSQQTKILVLHMKELVYTAIFLVLSAILIILLVTMFGKKKEEPSSAAQSTYIAGVYSSSIDFQNHSMDVQVVVDKDRIRDISLVNTSEMVPVMYPLMEPTIQNLREQILEQQSLENIQSSAQNQYTAGILLHAIESALNKAYSQ
ncbi:MAG: hypothetical protein J6B28_10025 [Eubacterium sp.]|nr:hypothetical protein [Eubacterium sp.]